MLETLQATGWDDLARELGATAAPPARPRRSPRGGRRPSDRPWTRLFYDEPIQVAARPRRLDHGCRGGRLLDAYNNVPCVGHGHPRVTAAIARQTARINTHMRYLHASAIELAERLAPPARPGSTPSCW